MAYVPKIVSVRTQKKFGSICGSANNRYGATCFNYPTFQNARKSLIHSFQSRDMFGDLEGRKLLAIAAHTVETQQKPANVPSHVYLEHLSAKEKIWTQSASVGV